MNGYHIALFFHFMALVAASIAAGLSHFGKGRMHAAASVAEARQWLALVASSSKVFPIALLVLIATGGYMVEQTWSWNLGWVDAALAGAILMFLTGAILGTRGRKLGQELGRLAQAPTGGHAPEIPHDAVMDTLSWANTTLALAIVFVMTTKPSLTGSLVALAVGVAVGVALAARPGRAPQAAPGAAPTPERALEDA